MYDVAVQVVTIIAAPDSQDFFPALMKSARLRIEIKIHWWYFEEYNLIFTMTENNRFYAIGFQFMFLASTRLFF